MKTCTHCGATKALSAFPKQSKAPDGLAATCKACRKVQNAAWLQRKREQNNETTQRWRRTENGREYVAESILMKRFTTHGLTLDQYHAFVEFQDFQCAICGEEPVAEQRRGKSPDGFHIDHDHTCCSGKDKSCGKCVRGLLCGTCNPGIGMLKSAANCASASRYLASHTAL